MINPRSYRRFYDALFRPIVERIGPIDADTLTSIVGFTAGGPVSVCTVGREAKQEGSIVTYVTCELAVRDDLVPSDCGPYELLMTCDNESWCRELLTSVGGMAFEATFGDGHTVDITPWVGEGAPIRGLLIEHFATVTIPDEADDAESPSRAYGILRLHGLTYAELKWALEHDVGRLRAILENQGAYPGTITHRDSVRLPE